MLKIVYCLYIVNWNGHWWVGKTQQLPAAMSMPRCWLHCAYLNEAYYNKKKHGITHTVSVFCDTINIFVSDYIRLYYIILCIQFDL